MSDSEDEKKSIRLESDVRNMKIEEGTTPQGGALDTMPVGQERRQRQSTTPNGVKSPQRLKLEPAVDFSTTQQGAVGSPLHKYDHEEIVGGDISVKLEPGKAPKLSRSVSQKIMSRPPPLFLDAPDKTDEATSTFQVIPNCMYAAKYLGSTEHALECDCAEEWSKFVAWKLSTTCELVFTDSTYRSCH